MLFRSQELVRAVPDRRHRFTSATGPQGPADRIEQRDFMRLLRFHPTAAAVDIGEGMRLIQERPELRMNLNGYLDQALF